MLLQMGGELGFHGYNHQPLALWDTDYGTLYDYKTWKNKETLVDIAQRAYRFPGRGAA